MDNSVLTFREYNIGGNALRAYYDADGKLVFVLDNTVDNRKPNALLVINPVGDRKWDDILANDYGVDLETVRPKKNNKYQKLDIEYSGLSEYDDLIRAYENGTDLSDALVALTHFREDSVRRAAAERLAMAESNADRARETITRARETIDELQVKLRSLRAQLSQQKKKVGREPTKQSASKILRTDAQIDATNEKLRRAKKRLSNAQRRLIVADEDAAAAREILARPATSDATMVANAAPAKNVVMPAESVDAPVVTSYNISYDDDVDDVDDDNDAADITYDKEIEFNTAEPKAENMADETMKNDEVQPLFDKNPDIMDEDIAFKPIEFGVSSPVENSGQSTDDLYDSVIDEKALSFTPPTQSEPAAAPAPAGDSAPINVTPVTNDNVAPTVPQSAPVLDTITSVDIPQPNDVDSNVQLDSELMGANTTEPVQPVQTAQPVRPAPVSPVADDGVAAPGDNAGMQNPMPAPAPAASAAARPVSPAVNAPAGANAPRPVSPITGTAAPTNPAPRKPTFVYYLLLILLIGLSIFTLWLYQRNTNDQVPDLTTTVPTAQVADVATDESGDAADSPFIPEIETPAPVAKPAVVEVPAPVVDEPEPVAQPEPEPVPVPVSEPEPEPEPEPVAQFEPETVVLEPQPVQDADVVIESVNVTPPAPVNEPEPVVVESEEDILASKPAYNVSQNENMFVADSNYDTETLRNENMVAVDTTGPSVVTAGATTNVGGGAVATNDEYVPQSVTSVVWQEEVPSNLPACPDGSAPDVNGCCPGEIYTDMGDMGFNCCPQSGGDCFPPLI